MARRWFKIGAGMAAGVTSILGLFLFLSTTYGFVITDLTGDFTCAGTYEDPCISHFTVKNPTPYDVDVYSKDQVKLDFSPDIKDYALFVPDGRCSATGSCRCELDNGKLMGFDGWRCVDFTNATKPRKDKVYNFRFSSYSTTEFKLVGIKNHPSDTIKWGFGTEDAYLDPAWYGTPVCNGDNCTAIIRDIIDDSWVEETDQSANYGDSENLTFWTTSLDASNIFIKFNSTDLDTLNYTSIKLYLYLKNYPEGTGQTIRMRAMNNSQSWDEDTLNWTNRPDPYSYALADWTAGVTFDESEIETWLTWDILATINQSIQNGDDEMTIAAQEYPLVQPIAGNADFASKEETNTSIRPYIEVVYDDPGTTSTCDYSGSGNFVINCSEGCMVDEDYTVEGNITFYGSGTIIINSTITYSGSDQYWSLPAGCEVVM